MIDLETFGTSPGCVVVQIGAAYFDRDTGVIGNTFSKNIDPRDAKKQGFVDELDTMLWWLDQSKEAQNSIRNNERPIIEVLIDFSIFARGAESVWSHSNFDFPIIMRCYKTLGIEAPFSYKSSCDLRTICKLAKINLKDRIRMGIQHNALDDCIFQIGYTVDCLKILRK